MTTIKKTGFAVAAAAAALFATGCASQPSQHHYGNAQVPEVAQQRCNAHSCKGVASCKGKVEKKRVHKKAKAKTTKAAAAKTSTTTTTTTSSTAPAADAATADHSVGEAQ